MKIILKALILSVTLGFSGAVVAQSGFTPPEVTAGENGWETYVDAPQIEKSTAGNLNPDLSTPEGAVVLFLASRVRGDKDWQDAMVSSPDRKGKKAIKDWKDWTLNAAELKGRKIKQDRGYVSVWMDFTISGESDSGTDDFTVVREGDEWRVASPPS
ncbi:MAG: hypothetical protein P1U83_13085 [Roseovarius sp.]|nr:hypothetical protein [Roseovarius sp.]